MSLNSASLCLSSLAEYMHLQAWWVSGYYPAALAPADMWIAGAFSAAVIAGIVDAEVTLSDELQRMQVL
jgi:hypothetical protein